MASLACLRAAIRSGLGAWERTTGDGTGSAFTLDEEGTGAFESEPFREGPEGFAFDTVADDFLAFGF